MAFPKTRQSAILGLHDGDATVRHRSMETVASAYWEPVCKYLRLRWHESYEDAADLTQAFFSKSIESATLIRYEPSKGTFRTYLRSCLDHFVLNARKTRNPTVPLDFDFASQQESPEELFHREWLRSLFTSAVEDLRARRGDLRFRVFERYDLNDSDSRPTYDDLAAEFGVTTASITNYLASMRRAFRKAVLDRLRDLTLNEREFRTEVRALFGIEV
ncbi:MAG: sigma-70 family RNA polymerase sigma factor [Acidobacteriaceae bacterium]|nr:sigma-70 family RNA polymerase sigma factor [Acidobacteriaceae bacterium]MBV9780170.1 sigma-70 family RNA polymerase sigma factor [Acidobacteriaceae bacterium]